MTPYIKKDWIPDGISCLFILLFFYAAVSKLLAGPTFLEQVGQSPLLTSYAAIVVVVVPLIELLLSVLLLKNRTRLLALYGCFALMVLFTAYIIAITRFSDYVPCSCGGILERLDWNQHLVFNSVFVVLSVIAILLYKPSLK
jgi:hypothetical protein